MRKLLTIFLLICLFAISVFGQYTAKQKPMMGLRPNWAHFLSDGLVGLWIMNEGSGNKVFDLSGNGKNGILVNSPTWSAGNFGLAVNFVATSSQYINCGTPIVTGYPYTLVAWFKANDVATTYSLITLYKDGTNYSTLQAAGTTGGDPIVALTRGTTYRSDAKTTTGFIAGKWHQAVGVYANSTERYAYIDGGSKGTGTLDSAPAAFTSLLLAAYTSTTFELDGSLGLAMIYNRALSASEIALLYREPFCMFKPSFDLLLYAAAVAPDWIGIDSSHLDSDCGITDLAGALDGTEAAYHYTDETHWFIIDLGESYDVQKVRGRSESDDDPIDVDIYVSNNKSSWGAAVKEEITTWQDTTSWVEIDTTDKNGRYVKVEIIDTEHASDYLIFGKYPSPDITIFDVYGVPEAAPAAAGQIIFIIMD